MGDEVRVIYDSANEEVIVALGPDEIGLTIEEAAILCYQLQKTLKYAQDKIIQKAVKQTINKED